MISKKIKFTDYDGTEREETFWFNLSKGDLVELELDRAGGLERYLTRISELQDTKLIKDEFIKILKASYGVKSPDGRLFIKDDEGKNDIWNNFRHSEAYSELLVELISDAEAAAKFIEGILPAALIEETKTKFQDHPAFTK